ncbi:hypothetical protein Ancab_038620 [Ancistrocladus abbreviatus]
MMLPKNGSFKSAKSCKPHAKYQSSVQGGQQVHAAAILSVPGVALLAPLYSVLRNLQFITISHYCNFLHISRPHLPNPAQLGSVQKMTMPEQSVTVMLPSCHPQTWIGF